MSKDVSMVELSNQNLETRYFFQLYAEERRKGNRASTSMNRVGKQNIMDAFEDRFKKGYSTWQPFKNKYDTSKKKYTKFKQFIYAYLGVPGRAHDTKVLTHCARYEASFPHPPPGKYYLVDSGYPTRTGYLGPHRGMRYHLGQFARGGPPLSARELFNRKHSGLRSVIERTFGVWKAKWRILDRKHPKYGLVKWIKLVTATMALHNFIRDSHREDYDFVHWQSDDREGEDEEADGDEEEGGDDDDDDDGGGGQHTVYMPTGDRAMEALRKNITNEYGRGRLPY